MIKTTDKIILGVLFILLISMSSAFIAAFSDGAKQKSSGPQLILKEASFEQVNLANNENDDKEISSSELQGIDGIITESKAIEIALAEVNGKVIEVEAERENGLLLYEVVVNNQGKIAEVEVDAQTGRILEVEWEDDNEDDD